MTAPTPVTRATLTADLRTLGLLPGIKVLVHSDLARLGDVEDGPEAVIDALLAAVGPAGTILMPALTSHASHTPANPPTSTRPRRRATAARSPRSFASARRQCAACIRPTPWRRSGWARRR